MVSIAGSSKRSWMIRSLAGTAGPPNFVDAFRNTNHLNSFRTQVVEHKSTAVLFMNFRWFVGIEISFYAGDL